MNKLPDLFFKRFQSVQVPALGFGTFQLEGETCRNAVGKALSLGYRHVDTARVYGNEDQVGAGLRDSGLNRSDIFVTSKVWLDHLKAPALLKEVMTSLELLQTDYLDLVLIHWPNPDVPFDESFRALEELKTQGVVIQYGVSNFPPSLLSGAINAGEVFCNQVEYHPFLGQDRLLEIARENDIMLTAYSPLAQGGVIGHAELEGIADKHGKSSGQIALRWLIEQDQVVAIPRSSKPEHIEKNFDIFDFALDDEDRAKIAALPKNRRRINPGFAPDWEEE